MRHFMILSALLLLPGISPAQDLRATSPDGVPVRYDVTGAGETAIVLVHGWSCDRSYWDAQVPALVENHRVVTIDLAGHGESGTGRDVWSMESFGEDVAAVVRALDLEQVVLVGHSMGGPVVVEAARRLGDRVIGIVGVDTFHDLGYRPTPEYTARMLALLQEGHPASAEAFARGFFLPTSDSVLVDRIARDMAAAPLEVAMGAAGAYYRWWREESENAFSTLRVPLVLINAESPPTLVDTARTFVEELDVKIVPGVGHFVMIEAPDRFNQALAAAIHGFPRGR